MKTSTEKRDHLADLRPGFELDGVAVLADQLMSEGDAEWRLRGEHMARMIKDGEPVWTVRREWSRWAHHRALGQIREMRLLVAQDEFANVIRGNCYTPISVGQHIRVASKVLDLAVRDLFGCGPAAESFRQESCEMLLRNAEAPW